MLLVIPEIQLRNGECTECILGEPGTQDLYRQISKNPDELCMLLRRENAKSIHILDVDSILNHDNNLNMNTILFLSQAVDIPIQVYSNFKSTDACKSLLDNGVYRIIIDELAFIDPNGVKTLINNYTPSRIVFYCYTKGGRIVFDKADKTVEAEEFAHYVRDLGGNRIIYGDEDWQRKDINPDIGKLKKFSSDTRMRITIANGIRTASQLWELNDMIKFGIDSVILGSALYNNNFPCQKIWRKIEAELEPTLISRKNSFL